MANLMAFFSSLVKGGGVQGLSASGAGVSPSSGGKSWIDQLLFIERRVTGNV
jgi:hypothetical protein